jgi:MurNAc alpha-1-phosphate uridylyltransferase
VWQIEALARAGFTDIVINVAHLPEQFVARLGDGRALGVNIAWSIEPTALESAGGIATALPLLPEGPAVIVSADVWSTFDYATLVAPAEAMACDPAAPRAHLVMVGNPPYHPRGDFAFGTPREGGQDARGRLASDGAPKLTYGNIGVYDLALFAELPRHAKIKLGPLLADWIARGIVSAEVHRGPWANVGTPSDLARLDTQLRELRATPAQS